MGFKGANLIKEFSQDKIIEKLEPLLEKEEIEEICQQFECIKEGFCYALSLEWLRLCKKENNLGLTLIDEGNKLLDNKGEAKNEYYYYKQIVNNFVTYAKTFAGNVSCEKGILLREIINKDLCGRDSFFLSHGTNQALQPTQAFDETDTNKLSMLLKDTKINYYFVGFNLFDETGKHCGGHQVAFCRKDNKLYFFDPNAGVFEVGNIDEFVSGSMTTYFGEKTGGFSILCV